MPELNLKPAAEQAVVHACAEAILAERRRIAAAMEQAALDTLATHVSGTGRAAMIRTLNGYASLIRRGVL